MTQQLNIAELSYLTYERNDDRKKILSYSGPKAIKISQCESMI